jgi:hypothetical protein
MNSACIATIVSILRHTGKSACIIGNIVLIVPDGRLEPRLEQRLDLDEMRESIMSAGWKMPIKSVETIVPLDPDILYSMVKADIPTVPNKTNNRRRFPIPTSHKKRK